VAQAVRNRYKLAPALDEIRFPVPDDYKAAEEEQLFTAIVNKGESFNPLFELGGKTRGKIFEARQRDPLEQVEYDYDDPDDMLEDLDLNPLEPIAWVDPREADAYCDMYTRATQDD